MSRRIVIEEPCKHHEMQGHTWFTEKQRLVRICPGGSRIVLSEPSEEMVERAAITIHELRCEQKGPTDGDVARAALTAALFSSDVGEREET